MTNKELIEDLLIEFDELDMQPMNIVPNPLDRAKAWKHELTYAIRHLKAEVARDIFAEIDRAVEDAELEWGTIFGVKLCIAELKKKYTEEKS